MNDDLISRQAAIDALKETDDVGVCWKGGYVQRHSDFEEAINCIKELPSAEPKKGKWKFVHLFPDDTDESPTGYMGHLECSICGGHAPNQTGYFFCPNCGADMRESE